MGEQSNAYRILLRYDRKSRHRRIKKQRRYERLAATSQFLYPQPSRAGIARTLDHARWTRILPSVSVPGGLPRSPLDGLLGHSQNQMQCWFGDQLLKPWVHLNPESFAIRDNRSYPCGNFSGTSSLKFRGTKGSIGHTFMVCIHTENQNQGDFYPFVLLEISVLHESPLGHLRYGLTDVPPQPNSPPDNVFNPDRPARDLNARSWAVKPSSASLNK